MKITVLAKANAKFEKVEKVEEVETVYKVWTKKAPVEGKANAAIVKLLAEYLKVPRSSIQLISGAKGKKKLFEITFNQNNSGRLDRNILTDVSRI